MQPPKGMRSPNIARIIELIEKKEEKYPYLKSKKNYARKLEDITNLDFRTAMKVFAGIELQSETLAGC